MSRFFSILKQAGLLIPPFIRNWPPLQRLAIRLIEKTGDHNDIYSARYYQTLVEPYVRASAPRMARSILDTFNPASVVDIGCGSGAVLVELRRLGVRDLLGVDFSDAGLDIARARGLDVKKFNLVSDQWDGPHSYDLAVSMETAEHLPASAADKYVELLCSLAPIVIFTAAHPGQGGIGHLNEQPRSYWVNRFRQYGMAPNDALAIEWKRAWADAGVSNFYTDNLMIFERS